MRFHWQNLNDKPFSRKGSGLRHGRCWWHIAGDRHRVVTFCWLFWSNFCHLSLDIGDEWTFSAALPPFAFWLEFDGFAFLRKISPKRKCIATWDEDREFWLVDEREIGVSVHDWTVWLKPWCRAGEWRSKDPWWVRGVDLNIPDLALGKTKYAAKTVGRFEVTIPMPESSYRAEVAVEHRVWKRPRWFATERRDAKIDIPGGIPFPGKGENSWDCGMDGLFGYGCSSTRPEDIVAEGVRSVLESRRRYGGSVDWRPELTPGG